jgi:hypothetical protein
MFTERREVSTRDNIRQLSDAEFYERTAQAAEAIGEKDLAAILRRMARS